MRESVRLTLTIAETADRLGVSPRTVNEWCHAGLLPALRIGKRWLVPAAALEAFVAEQTRPATLPPPPPPPVPFLRPAASAAPARHGPRRRKNLTEEGY